ncbi:MAG: hypothetical protein AAFX87_23980 [Bacteroidota bacterium]
MRFTEYDLTDSYICPLSFRIFSRNGLSPVYEDQLTAEHAPPKALGGRKVALTTQLLNNTSGHTHDIRLLNYINHLEFRKGKSAIKTKFKIDNQISLSGRIYKKGYLEFDLSSEKVHLGIQKAMDLMRTQSSVNFRFSLPNLKSIELAFLRTAYLIAFSELGYSFIFGGTNYINQNCEVIRKQLLEPRSSVISDIIVLRDLFSDEFLGVNIIHEPEPLRSVLVVFDLKTDNEVHRFGVILPGPDEYGFHANKYFKENIGTKHTINFKAYTFPNGIDLTEPSDSMLFLKVWKELNGFTKQTPP